MQDTPAIDKHFIKRAFKIALATVVGFLLVGFYIGVREESIMRSYYKGALASDTAEPDIVPAYSYRELPVALKKYKAVWQTELSSLRQNEFSSAIIDETAKSLALAQRSERRAYQGAPPTIPHAITQRDAKSCMACHAMGLQVGDLAAPKMPHPVYASCTQCHAESSSLSVPVPDSAHRFNAVAEMPFIATKTGLGKIDNTFSGKTETIEAPRAWPKAPPLIPHSTWMRNDCLSCHGPTGKQGIRTTHPERLNCRQCHGLSGFLDQTPIIKKWRKLEEWMNE